MIKKTVFVMTLLVSAPSVACDEHSAFDYLKTDPVAAAIDRQTIELERQQRLRTAEEIYRDPYGDSINSLNNTMQLQNTILMPPR